MKKTNFDQIQLDAMNKDLANWYGPFYVNKKDPRVFVHKFNNWMGYTVNFGNPASWVVLVAFIAAIVLVSL